MSAAELGLAAVVLLAAFTQGSLGFGFGLVVMSVAPRLWGVERAVPFTAVFGLFVAASVCWRYRRHVQLREVLPMLAGAAFGLPLGVLALRELDPEPCIRALGACMVLYVAYAAWPRGPRTEPAVGRGWAVPAGLAAGVFGGAFAMGGPPVITYASARRHPPAAFKGILQAFFTTATAAHLALLAGAGMIVGDVLRVNLLLAPAVPAGLWLGARYGDRLPPRLFRLIVLFALLLLGLGYLVRGR